MSLHLALQHKIYPNGTTALTHLEFKLQQGEFVALVAPSGAGKTTLLKLIAGLDTDYQGVIQLTTPPSHTQTLPVTMLFQEPRLMPWLTVRENIELVIPDSLGDALATRVQQLLTQADLAHFAEAYPKELSGGMLRRVALIRAFIRSPHLLLMDEPFQGLDAPTANQLRQMLLTLWQETRSTVLFVTHSLREALMLADRILFLSARPARLILDYPVLAARPRDIESAAIHHLHQQLLTQYPALLSGQL